MKFKQCVCAIVVMHYLSIYAIVNVLTDSNGLKAYRYELAHRALKDESMPDAEKLKNIIGDSFYEERKKIIQRMIDDQHIDPNTIMCFDDETPLYESVLFKDISFTQYLLEKGAQPDKKILKMMKRKPALMALLKIEK